jgi:hypothetical protein
MSKQPAKPTPIYETVIKDIEKSDLEPEIKKQAVDEINQLVKDKKVNSAQAQLSTLLGSLFSWNVAPSGPAFWSMVNDSVYGKTPE